MIVNCQNWSLRKYWSKNWFKSWFFNYFICSLIGPNSCLLKWFQSVPKLTIELVPNMDPNGSKVYWSKNGPLVPKSMNTQIVLLVPKYIDPKMVLMVHKVYGSKNGFKWFQSLMVQNDTIGPKVYRSKKWSNVLKVYWSKNGWIVPKVNGSKNGWIGPKVYGLIQNGPIGPWILRLVRIMNP